MSDWRIVERPVRDELGEGTLWSARDNALYWTDILAPALNRLSLADGAHIGNFVEAKNTRVGVGSKANHLAYLGDAVPGAGVNIGAGAITCNYDGANKSTTTIGDNAFIGSNASLVAPVTIGDGATIGAGSVINKDAPAGKLTIARAKQATFDGWRRPAKKKP